MTRDEGSGERTGGLLCCRERELGALSLGGRRAPARQGEVARHGRRRARCDCCFVGKRGGAGAWAALLLLLSTGENAGRRGQQGVLRRAGEEGCPTAAARGRMSRGHRGSWSRGGEERCCWAAVEQGNKGALCRGEEEGRRPWKRQQ
jgi:hypothetical protein